MKKIGTTAAIVAACTLGATAALAQTAATTAPQAATPPPAAAPAAPATSASFTDGDVEQFATAVIAVQKVQKDSSVAAADKQAKMAAAVEQAGLTSDKFNSMGQTSQSDSALRKRIQKAVKAKMPRGADTYTPRPGEN